MKYLILSLFLILGCGQPKDGKPGKDGKSITGQTGQSGAKGKDGKDGSGRNGLDGDRGDRGYPGNIDNLIDDAYQCNGRFDAHYGWYELNFWVYNLSTKERYLFGRSDLHRDNDFDTPDSSSFFGDSLETASFVFTINDKKSRSASWRYKRDNRRGNFSCAKIRKSK